MMEMSTPSGIYALHHQHLVSALGFQPSSSSSTLQGALIQDMAPTANLATTPPSSVSPVGSRPTTAPHGDTNTTSSALSRPLPSGFGLQPVIDSPLPSIPELPHHPHHDPSPPAQLPAIHAALSSSTSPSPPAVTPSSSWPLPPQHPQHQLPPPSNAPRRHFPPPALDVQPFAYHTQLSTLDTWGGVSEGRRWSMTDQPHHVPPPMYSQRPWTSSASSSSFAGSGGSTATALSHLPSSSSSSTTHAGTPSHHNHSEYGNNFGASSASSSGHHAPPPSSSPSYSSDNLVRPHSHHSHQAHSPSSYLSSSRPSTTSSLSSYASSLATPHSGPLDSFFGASSGGLKRSDGSSFYSIGGANESTDTIVGVPGSGQYPPSSHPHHHHAQQHYPIQAQPQHQSHLVDDSNPFFFGRELQSLQVSQERAQATSSLRRPSSSSSSLHPTLQSALASTSPSDAFQFYNDGYGPTPPSTAGSATYFENGTLPRPPSGYRPNSSGGLLSTAAAQVVVDRHLISANTVGSSNPNAPSPYSLIVENPDPATKSARPHLCTHCNETFRRIHDAKRHAYGALGIKNYACMGGCGMTFKRSEGRARHWQREEVAGVGHNVSIAEFFALNPGMVGTPVGSREGAGMNPQGMMIWGGKGCETRHGLVMNGTMEEDRRLRNKARRERILMLGTRADKKKDDEREECEEEDGVGPMRKQRTSYASVSPY